MRTVRGTAHAVGVVLAHDITLLAAALTYYTVLSLVPALLVVVAILGLAGLSPSTVDSLLESLGSLGAPWAAEAVSAALDSVVQSSSSGLVLIAGLAVALWSASAYVGAFMAASDRIHDVPVRRPFWQGLPLRIGLALLLLVVLSVTAAAVALVGPFGDWVSEATGIGTGPLRVWTWIKWPLLLGLGLVLLLLLYELAPSRRPPAPWRVLPGAVCGLGLWLVASAGFTFYLERFSSYDRVYGTLGAAVAFLVWAWLLNLGVLLGAELDAALERRHTARREGAAAG